MTDRGWTLYRTCKESGVLYSTLQSINNGKTAKPDVVTLQKLANTFGDDISTWLKEAGHINENQAVKLAIKERFGPLFNDEVMADFLSTDSGISMLGSMAMLPAATREPMAEALRDLEHMPESKLIQLIQTIETLARGLNRES